MARGTNVIHACEELIRQSTLGRVLSILATDHRLRRWRRRNPNRSFADFYAQGIAAKIKAGRHHRTIGDQRKHHIVADRTQRDGDGRRGLGPFGRLVKHLATDADRVVEYGCGSLRVGRHFIEFLKPDRYVGLDVTDDFFSLGWEALPEPMRQDKRPEFQLIKPATLVRIRAQAPRLVFANAVIKHVPPHELKVVLEKMCSLAGPETRIALNLEVSERSLRIDGKSWAHSITTVKKHFEQEFPDRELHLVERRSWWFLGREIRHVDIVSLPYGERTQAQLFPSNASVSDAESDRTQDA